MLGAALAAAFLYWLLRQMEHWLQQHLFKVGWLLTKDFRTTTVLYYVFFLPGVLLHELALWLAAGIFNVRADRATQFPQPQEIPELRLNFVRISPRAPKWKVAMIELAPPAAGIAAVALIANGVLDIAPALSMMRTGDLDDISAGFALLSGKTDFWLWTYILFTIANTMSPKLAAAREALLRPIMIALGVAAAIVFALGLVQDTIAAVTGTLQQVFDVLAAVFGITVVINAAAIFGLAVVENTIERITGDSATIDRNGKLVAKKRAEILAEREQERQRAIKAREAAKARAPSAVEGIPSIYRLPLPLPDTPETAKRVVMAPPPVAGALEPPRHREPTVIEATADFKVEQIDDDIADELDEDDEMPATFGNVVTPSRPAVLAPTPQPPRNELNLDRRSFEDQDEADEFDDDESESG